jgi:hypothetical protein
VVAALFGISIRISAKSFVSEHTVLEMAIIETMGPRFFLDR